MSEVYDSLASSLLHWDAQVSKASVGSEAFFVNGKVYTYFGPWPALLRIPLNYFFPQTYGLWGPASTLIAALLSILAFALVCRDQLAANINLSPGERSYILILTVLGLSLGSPLCFLVSAPVIWHEAIAWAFCGSLFALLFFLRLSLENKTSWKTFFGLSVSSSICLLSRSSFALTWLLLIAFFSLLPVLRIRKLGACQFSFPTKLSSWLALVLPFATACLYQGWYNWDRFGSPFTFILNSAHVNDPIAFGGAWNVQRIPGTILNYLGIRAEMFSSDFPFVKLATVKFLDDSLFFLPYREWTISLLLSSPWLFFGACFGVAPFFKHGCPALYIALLAGIAQAFIVLTFYFITQRYGTELLMLPLFFYCYGLRAVRIENVCLRVASFVLFSFFVLAGVYISLSSTLQWCAESFNWMVPEANFKRMISEGFSLFR